MRLLELNIGGFYGQLDMISVWSTNEQVDFEWSLVLAEWF